MNGGGSAHPPAHLREASISPEYELEGYSYYDTPTGPAFVRNEGRASSGSDANTARRRTTSLASPSWHPYAMQAGTNHSAASWSQRTAVRPISPYVRQPRVQQTSDLAFLSNLSHATGRLSAGSSDVTGTLNTPPAVADTHPELANYLVQHAQTDHSDRSQLGGELSENASLGGSKHLQLDVTGALRGTMHSFLESLDAGQFEQCTRNGRQVNQTRSLSLTSPTGSAITSQSDMKGHNIAQPDPPLSAVSLGLESHTWIGDVMAHTGHDALGAAALDTAIVADTPSLDFARFDLFEYGPFDETATQPPIVPMTGLPGAQTAPAAFSASQAPPGRSSLSTFLSDDDDRPPPQVGFVGGYHAPLDSPLEVNERGSIRIERLVARRPSIKYEIPEDVSDMTVAQLKTELRNRSLQATGKKEVLQARLLEAQKTPQCGT